MLGFFFLMSISLQDGGVQFEDNVQSLKAQSCIHFPCKQFLELETSQDKRDQTDPICAQLTISIIHCSEEALPNITYRRLPMLYKFEIYVIKKDMHICTHGINLLPEACTISYKFIHYCQCPTVVYSRLQKLQIYQNLYLPNKIRLIGIFFIPGLLTTMIIMMLNDIPRIPTMLTSTPRTMKSKVSRSKILGFTDE